MAGLEGRTLDRYELRQLVGKGGMAEVYLAYDRHFERTVAVKVFKRSDEEMLRRFIREARLMASLRHPHLVPIYDAGEYPLDGFTQYYIVMPFMEGGTLRGRIRQGPLAPLEACRYLSDIADALDYVHAKGIIHRDIKSSNVLLSNDGQCYLADFGIARATSDATQLTSTGNVLGTVDYVAPELFEVNRRADARSDYYSLGVLLFEMVTGQLPFAAENQIALVSMHMNKMPPSPRSISRTVSPQVERVIFRALEKRPELRYPSATALAQAFCQAATEPAESDVQPYVSGALWEYSPSGSSMPDAGNGGPLVLPAPIANAPRPIPPPRPVSQSAQPPRQVQQPNMAAGYPPSPPPAYQATMYQQPASQPAQRRSPARTRAIVVLTLALVVLLAVTIPIVYAVTHSAAGTGVTNPGQTQTAGSATGGTTTAGTTATVNGTATAQVVATATANAQAATATASVVVANAQASATPGVFQTAIANATYTDSLTSRNNADTKEEQWDQSDVCSFKHDGYHVIAGTPLGAGQFVGCHETAQKYSDVAISVDITIMSGHSGGLFFRMNTDFSGNYSGYLFEIDTSTGRYKISTTGSGANTIQDWTDSSVLKRDQEKNTLQVLARGNNLYFYINGTLLQQPGQPITDTTFSTGNIGFLADSNNGGPNTEVVYTNLKVSPQQA